MHVLVEVHHLEAFELIGYSLYLVFLVRLLELDTFGIPDYRLVLWSVLASSHPHHRI